jgi:hypothetical protein
MAVDYTNDLSLAIITTGTEAGNWGDITNTNFQSALVQAIGGKITVSFGTSTTQDLPKVENNSAQNFRALFLTCSGSPTGAATLTVPAINKLYVVKNNFSTSQTLTVKIGSSTGTTIPNGKTMLLYANGSDVIITNDYFSSIATTAITATGALTATDVTSFGTSVTLTPATWSFSATNTVQVNYNTHGLSGGDLITINFGTGTGTIPPTQQYTVLNSAPYTPTTNSFYVFATGAAGAGSGSAASVYKATTSNLYSQLSTSGGVGTSGQVLTSQGTDRPPAWTSLTSFSSLTVSGTATFNGNTTIGSTTVNSGSSTMTTSAGVSFTITGSGGNVYSLAAADVVYIVTVGGSVPTGFYTVASVTGTSPNVTAFTCNYSAATATAGTVTSVTKYNNTATLQAPLSSFGSVGTSGYVLTSQGTGAPPQWTSRDTSTLVNGTTKLSVDSSGNFTSVVPSGSTLLPSFLPRAWVNFDGGTAANVSGTYSQSGTTVTVTITGHGLIVGNVIYADITSGTGVDGTYTVAALDPVDPTNKFTYTAGTSLSTSGSITLFRRNIRASGNVGSVTYANSAGRFYINFSTAMPDANYAAMGMASRETPAFGSDLIISVAAAPTAGALAITCEDDGNTARNPAYGLVTVIR